MPTFRFSIFRSIAAAGHDWDIAAPKDNFFLQQPYLQTLENNPPEGMRFGYLIFYKNEQPAGVAYCQIKNFKGDDNIQELEVVEKDPCFFTGMTRWFKKWVAGRVAADILICGNMLLTGEHGYYFNESLIAKDKSAHLLEHALTAFIEEVEKSGIKIPVILIKDIHPVREEARNIFNAKGFVEFEIQPNMVLDLDWEDFDGYLKAMSTKYRTRYKRAVKKLDGIEKRELSLSDMLLQQPKMYALYKDIAKNAGFNMVDLNEQYLSALKRDHPDGFRTFGYFFEGNMVAYYTCIANGEELEAHFLGYDKAMNHDKQLYLNILYDIVRFGLTSGFRRIEFARTALEIKSSVGAVPMNLFCYVRHQSSLYNKFTGTLLDYLKPVEQWQQRHPFKTEGDSHH